jgi:DNA-binding XRE family transcriptional regulator
VAPYIEVAPAEVPGLTGNLVKDVRAFTGLTHEEIASIWGVQSRTIQGVQSGEIPLERYESTLNVLLAIGRILIGGLGKKGVRKWFTIGQPSRLDRIVGGGLDAVHAEARDYMR